MLMSGLELRVALGFAERGLAVLVGGGGKTAALHRIVTELAALGRTVLVTTTTKIFRNQVSDLGNMVVSNSYQLLTEILPFLITLTPVISVGRGISADGKLLGLPVDWVDELWRLRIADYLIVEADGSRGKSLKAPADHEPVIPRAANLVIPVVGLDILGKPLADKFVHRPELVARIAGVDSGSPVTPRVISKVLAHPAGLRKGSPLGARVAPLINKVDSQSDLPAARQVAGDILLLSKDINSVVLGNCKTRCFTCSVVTRGIS